MIHHARKALQSGFTLMEVLLAVAITAVVMTTVTMTFRLTLEARDVVDNLAESTEAGPRIMNLLERDLRGLWTQNIRNNAVLRGRNMDVGSFEADRIDMLTTTDSVGTVLNSQNQPRRSPVNEVGYWLKQNPRYRDLMELWRREDPLVDDDLITQGSFQLVHDRIKSFRVVYYRTLGSEAIEELEWDSAIEDALPARMKIEFTIERKRSSRNVVSDVEVDDFEGAEKTYVRHIVFDERVRQSIANGTARIPVFPPEPAGEAGGAGGANGQQGPAGPAGPGGPGGRGGKPGDAGLAGGGRLGPDAQGGRGPGRGPATTQTGGRPACPVACRPASTRASSSTASAPARAAGSAACSAVALAALVAAAAAAADQAQVGAARSGHGRRSRHARGHAPNTGLPIVSRPPRYGRSAGGRRTEPSFC